MSFRFQVGQEDLALSATADTMNLPRPSEAISRELKVGGIHLGKVTWVRNVHHGNHPPAEFVKMPCAAFRLVKRFQAHPPTLIAWADGDEGLWHGKTSVRFTRFALVPMPALRALRVF